MGGANNSSATRRTILCPAKTLSDSSVLQAAPLPMVDALADATAMGKMTLTLSVGRQRGTVVGLAIGAAHNWKITIMESKIAPAIHLKLEPVALVWSDEKPAGAMEFAPGKWGCVLFLLAAAAKGKTAVASRETFGCFGGGVGLGFGEQYKNFPGGEECFCRFLSSGNAGSGQGQSIGQGLAASGATAMAEDFLLGERYLKNPEMVKKFVACLPIADIPARYVVMKPLHNVDFTRDDVRSITFLVNPDQLAALVVLANYEGEHNENVIIPFAAGCQSIGICTFRENDREHPRAVVGLVDLSARKNLRRQLGKDVMSLSVTAGMFQRMEGNVEGSFLGRETWKSLLE